MSIDPLTHITVRDLLIEHMDGTPVMVHSVRVGMSLGECQEVVSRRRLIGSLLMKGLLRTRVCGSGIGMETVITEKGRAALAAALANWADALCRANADPSVAPPPAAASPRWHTPASLK